MFLSLSICRYSSISATIGKRPDSFCRICSLLDPLRVFLCFPQVVHLFIHFSSSSFCSAQPLELIKCFFRVTDRLSQSQCWVQFIFCNSIQWWFRSQNLQYMAILILDFQKKIHHDSYSTHAHKNSINTSYRYLQDTIWNYHMLI